MTPYYLEPSLWKRRRERPASPVGAATRFFHCKLSTLARNRQKLAAGYRVAPRIPDRYWRAHSSENSPTCNVEGIVHEILQELFNRPACDVLRMAAPSYRKTRALSRARLTVRGWSGGEL